MSESAISAEVLGLPHECVLSDPIDVRARAHDASHFLLYPQAVVVPRNTADVAALMAGCSVAGVGLTFRSGGTSLSGQAGTDGVLADVRRHFDTIDILNAGERVRVQPGVTVNRLNAHLAPFGRKFGPDPASSMACTIGGVVANNSSGMACGTVENPYRTLESVVVVLPSGTVIDTGQSDADQRMRALEPDLYAGLLNLRQRIMANPASLATIDQQFSMKNTMGYGLNSLLDFDTPASILAHLMVGSEGTLGFVASATFRTVLVKPFVRTGLLVFESLRAANDALPALVGTGAATLELMDTASIRVGQRLAACPDQVAAIHPAGQAALLIEYQATSQNELDEQVAVARPILGSLPVAQPVELTSDPTTRERLWAMRKGLYTAVASARRPGTTALLEDVVVPIDALADTCMDLTRLFDEHGYADSVIFGHAKDGNIHFMITDEFDRQLDRYERFTVDMVDLILGQHGSLKAEHGTGRVMAPFVRRQYGDELYDVMREVKRLFDPNGLLNDGVVITDDPRIHLKHIKVPHQVDPLVDACVECGYCEPICPARTLTLTPRQRIAVQREIRQATGAGDATLVDSLKRFFIYDGMHTCAVDGMCQVACPVGINTGVFIKKCRGAAASPVTHKGWEVAAKHWAGATHVASFALSTARQLGVAQPALTAANKVGRRLISKDVLPLWSPDLPFGGRSRQRPRPNRAPVAVYIPACVNAMFGPARDPLHDGEVGSGVQMAFENLCAEAGLALVVPEGIDALCCGTPWTSKGMNKGYKKMAHRVVSTIKQATDNGRLPVVCDASSCTEGLQRMLANEPSVQIIDCVQFVAEHVLPHLGSIPKLASITLHSTCSSTQIGLNPYLKKVAQVVADQVHVPVDGGCCAFAGDRGMLHPELTRAATRPEAANVADLRSVAHASCNRTCEIGMTRATGVSYRHILEVLSDQVALRG